MTAFGHAFYAALWLSFGAVGLLMLLIGALIGLIVVLMYVPVFELAGSLQ